MPPLPHVQWSVGGVVRRRTARWQLWSPPVPAGARVCSGAGYPQRGGGGADGGSQCNKSTFFSGVPRARTQGPLCRIWGGGGGCLSWGLFGRGRRADSPVCHYGLGRRAGGGLTRACGASWLRSCGAGRTHVTHLHCPPDPPPPGPSTAVRPLDRPHVFRLSNSSSRVCSAAPRRSLQGQEVSISGVSQYPAGHGKMGEMGKMRENEGKWGKWGKMGENEGKREPCPHLMVVAPF